MKSIIKRLRDIRGDIDEVLDDYKDAHGDDEFRQYIDDMHYLRGRTDGVIEDIEDAVRASVNLRCADVPHKNCWSCAKSDYLHGNRMICKPIGIIITKDEVCDNYESDEIDLDCPLEDAE